MSPKPATATVASANPTHLCFAAAPLSPAAIEVRDALIARSLETPLVAAPIGAEEKRARIESLFGEIMRVLGLDLRDDSLADTPQRVAKMFVDEIFCGLDYRNFPKVTVVANKMAYGEAIRVGGISVSSTCEHHFVAVDGHATVAYIPKDKVIGLSKINRIVAFFAQRPQIQERLTEQVLLALQTLLGTDDVAVGITATHLCVRARGVMDSSSKTTTTSLGGKFKQDPAVRQEFLDGAARC
jgi:GTP cyclohydrolase I